MVAIDADDKLDEVVKSRKISGYLGNLKGAYTEYCASEDFTGDIVKGVSHINKGGLDYAVIDDDILKIIEAKARKALSMSDIKRYIKLDDNGNPIGFDADYVIRDIGEEHFKDKDLKKQFVLYLNGPESEKIKNKLDLPERLPYKFEDDYGIKHSGFIDIVVVAVNK